MPSEATLLGPEIPYRIALIVILVLTMAVVIYHRLQAASGSEVVSPESQGYGWAIALRLAGVALWLSVLGWLLAPRAVQWASVPLPEWVRWLGVAGGLACVVLMYWTLATLGKNLTDTAAIRAEATLVTRGPYRFVRHPYYVTAALLMLCTFLLSANWLIGTCSLLVLMLLFARTPREEQMLIERFGENYRRYMDQTGRFWPRPQRRR